MGNVLKFPGHDRPDAILVSPLEDGQIAVMYDRRSKRRPTFGFEIDVRNCGIEWVSKFPDWPVARCVADALARYYDIEVIDDCEEARGGAV